jgi:hypothetical protein
MSKQFKVETFYSPLPYYKSLERTAVVFPIVSFADSACTFRPNQFATVVYYTLNSNLVKTRTMTLIDYNISTAFTER